MMQPETRRLLPVAAGRRSPALLRRAALVLVRTDLAGWADRIRGGHLVLERDKWEAQGAGYRGATLGG